MSYVIYHPKNGVINHDCKRGLFEYEPIVKLTCNRLEDAFFLAQRGNGGRLNEYRNVKARSTCVGDIIAECVIHNKGNVHTTKYFMVMNHGFQEVPFTVITYIDWGNHI